MAVSFSIRQSAEEAPEQLALIDDGVHVSYRALASQADRAVADLALTDHESHPGSEPSIALVARAERESIARVLGLIDRGIPPLLVHPRLTPGERAALLCHFEARLVGENPDRPGSASSPSGPRDESRWPRPAGATNRPPPESHLLAVLFTSGSAGSPKGVALSHGAFRASAEASAQNLGWRPDDRWLMSLPLAHIGGLSIVTRCLAARVPFVLPAPGKGLDAGRLIECLTRDRVTLLSLVPTQLGALLDSGWACPPFLRAILLGGSSAPAALVAAARDRGFPILTSYGMTETCSQIATQRPASPPSEHHGAPALPGVQLRIAPEDSRIELKTPALMSGYLPRGAHPEPITADGWFRTSDTGQLNPEGELVVHGRADDVLITGGENVRPGEVEQLLEGFPGVLEAIVFGVDDARFGQLIAVTLRATPHFSREVFDKLCREHLASHRRPRQVVILSDFALTPGGKRDRPTTIALALEAVGLA